MPKADQPLQERVRDALFKHLAPPFAALGAWAIAGPVGPFAAAGATGLTAFMAERFTMHEERRRAERSFQTIADKAIGALSEFIEAEWPRASGDAELNADAAAKALAVAVERGMSNGVFYEANLDNPTIVDRLRREDALAGLNAGEKRLFDLALPKTIDAALALFARREDFQRLTAREILLRLSELERQVPQLVRDNVNAALVARGANQHQEFEARYRQALGRTLDRMELYGLQERGLQYPLEPAFVTLQLAGGRQAELGRAANDLLDDLSPNRGRLLVVGEAGAGKSTLLQWAGVMAAYQRVPTARIIEPLGTWAELSESNAIAESNEPLEKLLEGFRREFGISSRDLRRLRNISGIDSEDWENLYEQTTKKLSEGDAKLLIGRKGSGKTSSRLST